MSKLFNLGSQRPASLGKRRFESGLDEIEDLIKDVPMDLKKEDVASVVNIPSRSPTPSPRAPSPPKPQSPKQNPSASPKEPLNSTASNNLEANLPPKQASLASPKEQLQAQAANNYEAYLPPKQAPSAYPKEHLQAAASDNYDTYIPRKQARLGYPKEQLQAAAAAAASDHYEAYIPRKQNYQYPSFHAYTPQHDDMMPQPYFISNQHMAEAEHSMLKGKIAYLEEKVAQLKYSLEHAQEEKKELLDYRMTAPERELDKLQRLVLEREKMHERMYGLIEKDQQERIDGFHPKQDYNSNDNDNEQVEGLKSAIKSLETRLLKSEAERINTHKKYEMARTKLLLQSGFTSIHVLDWEEQDDHIQYMCSIKGKDGTLHFALIYPKDRSGEVEFIPQLDYKQKNDDFIPKLHHDLKCKVKFEADGLPVFLQFLLEEIPKK